LSFLHFTRDIRGEIVREGDCLDAIRYFCNNQEIKSELCSLGDERAKAEKSDKEEENPRYVISRVEKASM